MKKENKNPIIKESDKKHIVDLKQILDNIKLLNILLVSHEFKRMDTSFIIEKAKAEIRNNKGTYDLDDSLLKVHIISHVDAKSGKDEIFTSSYKFEIHYQIQNRESLEEAFKDNKAGDVFLSKYSFQMIWPYLRNEVHADTSKACLPPLMIPVIH